MLTPINHKLIKTTDFILAPKTPLRLPLQLRYAVRYGLKTQLSIPRPMTQMNVRGQIVFLEEPIRILKQTPLTIEYLDDGSKREVHCLIADQVVNPIPFQLARAFIEVKFERSVKLHEFDDANALEEGIIRDFSRDESRPPLYGIADWKQCEFMPTPLAAYQKLWNQLYAQAGYPWDADIEVDIYSLQLLQLSEPLPV